MPNTPSDKDLRGEILETIKGYEPVAHLDGNPEQNPIPNGFDLEKDDRTEYGFYWEFEDMEDCADKIMAIIRQKLAQVELEARKPFQELLGQWLQPERRLSPQDKDGGRK